MLYHFARKELLLSVMSAVKECTKVKHKHKHIFERKIEIMMDGCKAIRHIPIGEGIWRSNLT